VKLSWIWILTSFYVFLAHLAKGNVSFWHPLSILLYTIMADNDHFKDFFSVNLSFKIYRKNVILSMFVWAYNVIKILSWIWILTSFYVFLAHLAKGNVSFWHPLSIVR
jgi:hypothetical protein